MSAPAPDEEAALEQKVNLIEFILHEHTMLSLCCASEKNPPPIGVAGCCCVCVDDLSVRHKIVIFCFVLIANIFVAMKLAMGDHGWLWSSSP